MGPLIRPFASKHGPESMGMRGNIAPWALSLKPDVASVGTSFELSYLAGRLSLR